jgi:hypothetical protein
MTAMKILEYKIQEKLILFAQSLNSILRVSLGIQIGSILTCRKHIADSCQRFKTKRNKIIGKMLKLVSNVVLKVKVIGIEEPVKWWGGGDGVGAVRTTRSFYVL